MTREVKIGSSRFSVVHATDDPGDGGAYHEYSISRVLTSATAMLSIYRPPQDDLDIVPFGEFGHIKFQKGPVKENGVNGCHQEDLIAIVLDRLQCFQAGDFACRENALAITKLEEALHWLNHRTKDRVDRGVEGTSVI